MTSVKDSLPTTLQIAGRDIQLRLMRPGDREAMLTFARALPYHDLLFLRRDITDSEQVDRWLEAIKRSQTTTVLALDRDGSILGYSTVDRGELSWTSHVAELRVLVAERAREMGLGERLTHQAFDIALSIGIDKMMAQMTIDQQGAIRVFEGMGFRPEALLRDHVKDREGVKHDMLILTQSVAQFQARRTALGLDGV